MLRRIGVAGAVVCWWWVLPAGAAEDIDMSDGVAPVEHDSGVFRGDPSYEDKPYSAEAQLEIYGGKSAFDTPRPALEIGRQQYTTGPFEEGVNLFGAKNLVFPALAIYGDWRTAVAHNDNGALEQGLFATRLNLDVDLKLTATERLHAFVRPFDHDGRFTRFEFAADDDDGGDLELDGNLDTFFFEGDLGSIATGFSGEEATFDLPFSVGFMPLLFQNGVWFEDAINGVAFAIPARNSKMLDISNFDVTFFAGFDRVTTKAVRDNAGGFADHSADLYGIATFVEANRGYWEAGYGYTDAEGGKDDQTYHNLTIAHTRRFQNILSNSVRFVWNFGQDRDGNAEQTADGWILLVENSLITHLPSTLVPYGNFWIGFDRPQSLARDAGAGGILKNTGINFETDGLTGFPKLDDTGNDTFGGALGVSYLFDLSRQIVAEGATVQVLDGEAGRPAPGDQYALGLRYQQNLSAAWIVRADAIKGWRDNADDLLGARLELRRKF